MFQLQLLYSVKFLLQDIESTEESWRIETANLVRLVAQLEKDNVRLKNSLHETKGQVAKVKRKLFLVSNK